MNWTESQYQNLQTIMAGHSPSSLSPEYNERKMFIPPIPLEWYKAAMDATKGRGSVTINAIWLESKLNRKTPFPVRKAITDKLGMSKKARQTMVMHLKMMSKAGLVKLTTSGKGYPQVEIIQ